MDSTPNPPCLSIPKGAISEVGPAAQTLSAFYHFGPGQIFAQIAKLADYVCLPAATVRKHVRQLVAAGWLIRKGRQGRRTVTYELSDKAQADKQPFALLPREAAAELPTWSARVILALAIDQNLAGEKLTSNVSRLARKANLGRRTAADALARLKASKWARPGIAAEKVPSKLQRPGGGDCSAPGVSGAGQRTSPDSGGQRADSAPKRSSGVRNFGHRNDPTHQRPYTPSGVNLGNSKRSRSSPYRWPPGVVLDRNPKVLARSFEAARRAGAAEGVSLRDWLALAYRVLMDSKIRRPEAYFAWLIANRCFDRITNYAEREARRAEEFLRLDQLRTEAETDV